MWCSMGYIACVQGARLFEYYRYVGMALHRAFFVSESRIRILGLSEGFSSTVLARYE
jgi:hypothetical protein